MPEQLRLALGSDHAGFDQKNVLINWLVKKGYEVNDLGPYDAGRVDYPDYAALVGREIQEGRSDLGILFCGTGIGMAIAANKLNGIRAANCVSPGFARLSRQHNAANVLTLSARFFGPAENQAIIQAFVESQPQGGRHVERVEKINCLEREH